MFDDTVLARVRSLAQAFRDGELVALTLIEPEFDVEFRRTPVVNEYRSAPAAHAEVLPPTRPIEAITADVVGVVRFTWPAIAEGAELEGDRELAFVETLGIRNAVRSRGPGRVAAVYVTDGQPVEYGQPLFSIER